jgi:hypothetical protein
LAVKPLTVPQPSTRQTILPPQSAAAADALKKAKSQAGGSDIAGAAADAKDKAKGLLKGKGISALPGANPLAAVADQNADVRDAAVGYRDPAGAVQLDAASGACCAWFVTLLATTVVMMPAWNSL